MCRSANTVPKAMAGTEMCTFRFAITTRPHSCEETAIDHGPPLGLRSGVFNDLICSSWEIRRGYTPRRSPVVFVRVWSTGPVDKAAPNPTILGRIKPATTFAESSRVVSASSTVSYTQLRRTRSPIAWQRVPATLRLTSHVISQASGPV